MLRDGVEDQFEAEYRGKFDALLAPHGITIEYKRDRAGIDVGVHLTETDGSPKSRVVKQTRVWFQLKGRHRETLSAQEFESVESLPVRLGLEHLRFWYAAPEAVYLALYVESVERFVAEDVRDLVDREWGEALLNPTTFPSGQKRVTVHLRADAVLTPERIKGLLLHRSMRIDGPAWRGRPLGHRLDPLRSALAPMAPPDFAALVDRLLEVHGFRVVEMMDPGLLLAGVRDGSDQARLLRGEMYYTFEWTHPIFTEFGFSGDDPNALQAESAPFHVQGPCVVLIHEQVATRPAVGLGFAPVAADLQKQHGIDRLVVFANQETVPGYIGSCRVSAEPLTSIPPLDIDALAFNVLTATLVYLEFREKLTWRYVRYL